MTTLAEKFAKNKQTTIGFTPQPTTLAEKFAPKPVVAPTNSNNTPFTSIPGENPLIAGLKAVGNTPKSAFNLGKGVISSIYNFPETSNSILKIGAGAVEKGLNKLTSKNVVDENTQTFDSLTKMLKDRYGSLENLQKTAT